MLRNKIAKGFIISGALLLAFTAFLHLYLGLPPIMTAIESGKISKAPSIAPSELLGIWIAFSILLFFIVVILLLHIRKLLIDRFVIFLSGLASIAVAITMLLSNQGVHISVPLLTVPGILIIIGAGIFLPNKTGVNHK